MSDERGLREPAPPVAMATVGRPPGFASVLNCGNANDICVCPFRSIILLIKILRTY